MNIKYLLILSVIILSAVFITCEFPVFDNPVDSESDLFSGEESIDIDGDGIGNWIDVDDIRLISPAHRAVVENLTPALKVSTFNPEVVDTYWIQISKVEDFLSEVVYSENTLNSNILNVPNNTLEANTDYYWRAKAFDGSKWSDNWSNVFSFSIDYAIPTPTLISPSNSANINYLPQLDWVSIDPGPVYQLQVSKLIDFSDQIIIDDSTVTDESYQIVDFLENSSTYYWRVRQGAGGGLWGSWSSVRHFNIQNNLTVPTLQSPSNGYSFSTFSINFNWTDIADAEAYQIQVNTTGSFNGDMPFDIDDLTVSDYLINSGLDNATTYYWRVRSRKIDRIWSNWSTSRSFILNLPVPTLTNPPAYDTSPLLDCSNVTGATKYHIQFNTSNDFTGAVLEEDDTLVFSEYQVSTILANNTTYYWRARAEKDSLWSNWSSSGAFTVNMYKPSGPSPSTGTAITDTTPDLGWSDTVDASGYQIQVNTANDFTGTMIEDDNTLTTSDFAVTTVLENNTPYYWRVKIQNTDGVWGDWGAVWNFTVSLGIPIGLYPANGTTIIDTTPALNWNDVSDADLYQVQVNTASDFTGTMLEDDAALNASDFSVTTVLDNNTTYYWRVRIQNADGLWGDWSITWAFIINISPPQNLYFPGDGSSTSEETPLLNWEDINGISGFSIQVNTAIDFTGTNIVNDDTLTVSEYQISTALISDTTYYWRVKSKNFDDIWGDWSVGKSLTYVEYLIGDRGPGNGFVFYDKGIHSDGWRWLEATPGPTSYSNDEWASSIEWGYTSIDIPGASGTGIGTGKQNTEDIINRMGTGSTFAAQLCDGLILGGYEDWFLPSSDELTLIYSRLNENFIGGFHDGTWWSSSESSSSSAWCRNFFNGGSFNTFKNQQYSICAARAF